MKILVVDDDRAIRDALDRALRFHGYEVAVAADGLEALRAVASEAPDAIVLDVGMPGPDGFAVARRLRGEGEGTPILMLTARDAVPDRVHGLDAGADDYLVKPFALEELLARLRALLRRAEPAAPDPVLRYADLSLNPETLEVHRGDRRIELTRTEFDLLHAFLDNAGRVLTRDALHDARLGLRRRPSPPTRWRSTSATCAASSRRPASRACCRPSAASATRSGRPEGVLRARIAWIAAGAVALAIVLVSVALYVATARTLRSSVDARAAGAGPRQSGRRAREARSSTVRRPGRFGGAGGYVQVVERGRARRRPAVRGVRPAGRRGHAGGRQRRAARRCERSTSTASPCAC